MRGNEGKSGIYWEDGMDGPLTKLDWRILKEMRLTVHWEDLINRFYKRWDWRSIKKMGLAVQSATCKSVSEMCLPYSDIIAQSANLFNKSKARSLLGRRFDSVIESDKGSFAAQVGGSTDSHLYGPLRRNANEEKPASHCDIYINKAWDAAHLQTPPTAYIS